MYKNIDQKFKGLALIFFWVSISIGVIWFFNSLSQYTEYAKFIDGASIYGGGYTSSYTLFGDKAYAGKMGMIYSIILILTGTISSYLIYGFGEIINHLKNIDYKLNGKPKIIEEEKVSDEEIIKELEQDSENES